MEIKYKKIKDFQEKELQDLFLSVKWDSGNYPDKLKKAIKNSHTVYSAWDFDEENGHKNYGINKFLIRWGYDSLFPLFTGKARISGKGNWKKTG